MNSEIILLYLKFKQWYYGGITIVDTTIHIHTMTDEDSQLATELKSNHKETDTYILTQNMSVSHTIKLLYLEIPTNVFVDRKVAGDILLILNSVSNDTNADFKNLITQRIVHKYFTWISRYQSLRQQCKCFLSAWKIQTCLFSWFLF